MKDGSIKSLEDPVTRYIAGLRGSAYDDVTVSSSYDDIGRPMERGLHRL